MAFGIASNPAALPLPSSSRFPNLSRLPRSASRRPTYHTSTLHDAQRHVKEKASSRGIDENLLPGIIPLLLAGRAPDLLVLGHQLVFRSTPRRNHLVQIPRGGAHGFEFGLAAVFSRGNVKAQRLAVPRDR